MTQVVRPPIPPRPSTAGDRFGGITGRPNNVPAGHGYGRGEPDFTAIQKSPEFVELRRRFRRFAFPASALFFLWYLTYVLLAAFARDVMAHRLVGSVNVGLVLGLLQFASTLAITYAYVRYARTRLDPQAAEVRAGAGR